MNKNLVIKVPLDTLMWILSESTFLLLRRERRSRLWSAVGKCMWSRVPYGYVCAGPPGQVAAVSGGKEGMKQGKLGGILKDLGYTEDQVMSLRSLSSYY